MHYPFRGFGALEIEVETVQSFRAFGLNRGLEENSEQRRQTRSRLEASCSEAGVELRIGCSGRMQLPGQAGSWKQLANAVDRLRKVGRKNSEKETGEIWKPEVVVAVVAPTR
jgi:hypothetical protein